MENYEKVILTLRYVKYKIEVDVELPNTVPLRRMMGKIKLLLADFSHGYAPEQEEIILLHRGLALSLDNSLSSSQIWDGAILEVEANAQAMTL